MAGSRQNNKEKDIEHICTECIGNGRDMEFQEKWINPNVDIQRETLAIFPEACQNHLIFSQHSGLHPKHTVVIRSVYGTAYEHLHDTANVSIYAGGPGSMVGAAIDSVILSSSVSPNGKRGVDKPSKVMFAHRAFNYPIRIPVGTTSTSGVAMPLMPTQLCEAIEYFTTLSEGSSFLETNYLMRLECFHT